MRLALVGIALAACTSASPPRAVSSPAMRGAIAELDYFVGHWHAEAENPATKQRFELDYRVEPIAKGVWYQGTGSAPALGLEIHDVWGKDPVSGEIVRTIFDSAKTFGTVRSKGWTGDVLVLEGDAASAQGVVHVRETITKVNADEFRAVWEMRDGETWTAYSVETLRRK